MRKHLGVLAMTVALAIGAMSVGPRADAQKLNMYTVPGTWFGYVTDSVDVRRGINMTPEAIRKTVAEKGAKFVLINGLFFKAYLILEPAELVAPYAGQTIFVRGVIHTRSMQKGNELVSNTDTSPGFFTVEVTSAEPHAAEPDNYYVLGDTAGVGTSSQVNLRH